MKYKKQIIMLYHVREEYHSEGLRIEEMAPDPFGQFHDWFQEILKTGIPDPNAMTLSTCTSDGRPSSRVVLLKDYGEMGFSFFTNYESRKAAEMTANPHVCLNFFWKELHRQVRVEGVVGKLSEQESKTYFQSRPRDSQVGAWASPQSRPIGDRTELDQRVSDIRARFEGEEVLPLPPFWGGYLVVPDSVEFWQGQPSRLHDRFLYRKQKEGGWTVERLAP